MGNENKKFNSIDELINGWNDSPNTFSHLKVFMHLPREKDVKSGYNFLMITPQTFTKVKIKDLKVEDDSIAIEYFDCIFNETEIITIGIHDIKPQVIFVNWNDIKKMVVDYDVKDLLKFDY